MQKTDHSQVATSTHRKVRSSTTLNRKYVKRPSLADGKEPVASDQSVDSAVAVSITRSPKISRFNQEAISNLQKESVQQEVKEIEMAQPHPLQVNANKRVHQRSFGASETVNDKMTAKELKEQAIRQALVSASKPMEASNNSKEGKLAKATKATNDKNSKKSNLSKAYFGFGRVMLAFGCAVVAVFAIVYFVNMSMPDLSLRVAAMQTGIEASYPSYVPRDYTLSDITSEDGKIVLNFKNSTDNSAFSIIEESSSWDSNALLTNYVQDAYGDDYTILREQGLTIYVNGSNACWVNGGVVYKLKTTQGTLTKKQIKSIAVSL